VFPKYRDIEQPLLDELERRGGKAKPSDRDNSGRSVYEALADHFSLSKAERDETIMEHGTPRSKWENMVRYAVRSLRKTGAVAAHREHGVWELGGSGR